MIPGCFEYEYRFTEYEYEYETESKKWVMTNLPERTFERSSNRRGTDIRSTSPRGRSFRFVWSLVAAGREVLPGRLILTHIFLARRGNRGERR